MSLQINHVCISCLSSNQTCLHYLCVIKQGRFVMFQRLKPDLNQLGMCSWKRHCVRVKSNFKGCIPCSTRYIHTTPLLRNKKNGVIYIYIYIYTYVGMLKICGFQKRPENVCCLRLRTQYHEPCVCVLLLHRITMLYLIVLIQNHHTSTSMQNQT